MAGPKNIKFFLGSNTKRGFVPLFNQLRDPRNDRTLYILKGGPGSGKSSLMKRVAKTLEESGHFIEYIPCASDPDSLDAIYDHNAKIAIIDGTAPHTMDPEYPGAYDVILNLGDAWDCGALSKNRKEIMELCHLISGCHSMATACITSAAALLDSNRATASEYVNQSAVDYLILKFIGELKGAASGQENERLLSAVTVGNTLFFSQTLHSLCPRLYILQDEWGAASSLVLSGIRSYAQKEKLDFITCYCSVHVPDKIDHILFPSAEAGITTSNSFHKTEDKAGILADELMNPIAQGVLDAMIDHLFLAKQMIMAAGNHVARAKKLHDELEKYYIAAMDFSKVDLVYQKLIDEILS